jgi:hypothetical protein
MSVGWHVIGYDIEPRSNYPGEFRQASVHDLTGANMRDGLLIVASPPCEQFSRHGMPWTRARNPPPPDLSIVEACRRIAKEAGLPLVMENVRFAQPFIGKAKLHIGAQYLWGDIPLNPPINHGVRKKESYGSKDRLKRAKIPVNIGKWIGEAFWPIECEACGYRFDSRCGLFGCPNCHGEGLALKQNRPGSKKKAPTERQGQE